ncbi:AAA family ATPase [Roseateles sp.]|uniref:nucleotide-binding protein n=1 Tax=Roseateles sp. TaxID=1971397 RepID=UPI00286D3798|nr:AAA family ATPase [Roseateles sp.]
MTISEFITNALKKAALNVGVAYAHPTLYIFCMSERFAGKSHEARLEILAELAGLTLVDLASIMDSPMIELLPITLKERAEDYGYLDSREAEAGWLGAFSPIPPMNASAPVGGANHLDDEVPTDMKGVKTKAIHFYGYKGGQGRSTVLLALAKTLADAGFRVLLVDADIEAPSLDAMLETVASDIDSSLMGLSRANAKIRPLSRTYVGISTDGYVDLIAARPAAARFDMDFAAFLLNASLDTAFLKRGIASLRAQIESTEPDPSYDVVLFDHRTGFAPSVLPIMEAWPGPAVIFIRPDGMARHIQDSNLLDTLLAHDEYSPGAFVSFSLNPKMTASQARVDHADHIQQLLGKIGKFLPLDDEVLESYWIFWQHDQNLVDGRKVAPRDMSIANQQAISGLRSVLGLSGSAPARVRSENGPISLTGSGSTDQGKFILTPGLAKVFSLDSPYHYIFGRKGTGKTRLLTELVNKGMAQPLLVASDSSAGGLKSAGTQFQQALRHCNNDFEAFWWLLLGAALSIPDTRDDAAFSGAIAKEFDGFQSTGNVAPVTKVHARVDGSDRRVFVIDGVETAVAATDLRSFVEALFRFLAAVQFDRNISRKVSIRLLLRSDLATGASQNVEQQIEGSVLHLHWNKTAILNFALARIVSLPWFKNSFLLVCKKIEQKSEAISRGVLPDDIAESFLLEIFPDGLERNRLKTTTFFAAYFSDAGGGSGGEAAFYPRLFDGFLRKLAENCGEAEGRNIRDGRVTSAAVLLAYDQASKAFLGDVRTELYSFLNIDASSPAANNNAVDRLIAAFQGLQTPFKVDQMVKNLSERSKLKEEDVRQALASMQTIGMFEVRPGSSGELRARQLYKAGLDLKYVRTKAV